MCSNEYYLYELLPILMIDFYGIYACAIYWLYVDAYFVLTRIFLQIYFFLLLKHCIIAECVLS